MSGPIQDNEGLPTHSHLLDLMGRLSDLTPEELDEVERLVRLECRIWDASPATTESVQAMLWLADALEDLHHEVVRRGSSAITVDTHRRPTEKGAEEKTASKRVTPSAQSTTQHEGDVDDFDVAFDVLNTGIHLVIDDNGDLIDLDEVKLESQGFQAELGSDVHSVSVESDASNSRSFNGQNSGQPNPPTSAVAHPKGGNREEGISRLMVADFLASRLAQLLGSTQSKSIRLGDTYLQWAGDGSRLLVEVPSNANLPPIARLSDDNERLLVALGFGHPTDDLPNWWRIADDVSELTGIALSVVNGLVDAYGLPIQVVAADLGAQVALPGPNSSPAPFVPVTDDDNIVSDSVQTQFDYSVFALSYLSGVLHSSPWESTIPAKFFAIVDEIDHDAICELVGLAPIGPADARAVWFRKVQHGWIVDPTITRRLAARPYEALRSISADTARDLQDQLRH